MSDPKRTLRRLFTRPSGFHNSTTPAALSHAAECKNHGVLRRFAAAALALTTAGCLVGPDYQRPPTAAFGKWAGADPLHPSTQPSVPLSGQPEPARWWASFQDPILDSLIARAVESNLDLRQAEARVRQARSSRGVVASGLFPAADVSGTYTRSRSGGSAGSIATATTNPSSGGGGGTIITVPNTGSNSARVSSLWRVGFDASWEIDVFGGLRREVEAADADIRAAIADRRDVLVSLTAEVATDYIDLRAAQRQIAIAQENLADQRRNADVTRRRFQGGFVSRLDVVNAEAQVATTQSQIPQLEASARQAAYAIAVLLGRPPASMLDELATEGLIPPIPPGVPVGLPSDLLRRRPDIRRSEERLRGATARVGVAVADLFPRFSLTGSIGTQNTKFTGLWNWGARSWSFGPSVSWPIFDAGKIRSQIAVQNAAQEEAVANYEQTILLALRDVETALIGYAKEQEHRAALAEAEAANRQAVTLATQLYTQGQTDFLNVLSAQRALLESQDALVQSDRALAEDLVSLYKNLGGGWEVWEPQTTAASKAKAQ